MKTETAWLLAIATIAILSLYEVALVYVGRRHPGKLARTAHAGLREEWFESISNHPGSEILAVQTLRNSMMSATMTASTAVLGLMGTVTLAAPSWHDGFTGASTGLPDFPARLALELALMALLFASLVCSAMAVRYYNHAGFIVGMPVASEARKRWASAGSAYVRRAGLMYSWALHYLILIAPLLASMLHPAAGPLAAVLVVIGLLGFDRVRLG